jgi:hypothetical protein
MASMGDAQRVGNGGLSKLTDGPRTTSDLSKVGGGLTRGPNQGKKLAAATWSETWPAPGSTLDLDFANDRGWVRGVGQGRSMDAVTFTRASVGKYVDQDGIVQDAANGQPRFDWASTASTGAGTQADPYIIPLAANPTSNGLLIEEARTNRILWCRDATQTEWVKTNITAAKDQTGIDGVANAASSLTATANDGTCIQTITLASGSRTGSVYLKRITGTGNVQVSLDGSTYSTVDLSASEWRRIVLSGTVTNPTVSLKLAVSGDAVAMDYGQVEDGAWETSPILTTNAAVTRAIDAASISGQNFLSWYNQNGGTFFAEVWTNYPASATNGFLFNLTDGGNQNRVEFGQAGSGLDFPRFGGLIRIPGITVASFLINTTFIIRALFEKVLLSYNNSGGTLESTSSTGGNANFLLSNLPNLNNVSFQHRGYYKSIKYIPTKLTGNSIKNLVQR